MSSDEFWFYYGCASGSARKALQKLEEPNVMISYATANNSPFDTIEHLFIDSGGYSQIQSHQEYQTSDEAYLAYLEEHEPELFALRDYPCDPAVLWKLGRTVTDHQQCTTTHHRQLLDDYEDRGVDAEPVAVLQGWSPQQYLTHLEGLRAAGVLTRTVAIGSLAGRRDAATVARIIHQVREALPSRHRLHAFGVTARVLQYPRVVSALDSADSAVYEYRTRREEGGNTWREQVYQYLRMKRQISACTAARGHQQSLQQYAV